MAIADYHVHTNLSNCGARESTPAMYLGMCADEGVTDIGFSNHMWDQKVPGWSSWYENQDVPHVLSIREMIPEDTLGIKVHIGCEIEIDQYFHVAMAKETRELFDYVLIPTTHLHMRGLTIDPNVTELSDVRPLILKRMRAAIDAEVGTAIAHPFVPLGFDNRAEELIQGFTDAELMEIFGEVRDAGLSLEMNAAGLMKTEYHTCSPDGFPVQYLRLFTLARECGCLFHLGSDAHKAEKFKVHAWLYNFAKACGITEFCPLEEQHKKLYKK